MRPTVGLPCFCQFKIMQICRSVKLYLNKPILLQHSNTLLQLVQVMQQELQAQLTQTLKEDLSNPILRYYLQEDAFYADPNSKAQYEMPFNQIAAEVVAEVTLSNKTITNNSRVAANLLQNGKEILRNKKSEYFKEFLEVYEKIKAGYQCLTRQERSVFEYSVMAISNLILKLSLNMSRISIVILTKQQTVPMLKPFITAILFQKYLEKAHLRSKEANRKPEDHPHLLKQFPKITLVKISQTRNPFDRFYINKSQQLFSNDAHNVQLIEIYERESEYDYTSQIIPESNEKDKDQSYNVSEHFGLVSPLGMEFYLFFSEIIIPRIQAYKPDMVIYYEDMPCGQVAGVEPAVKGLIINTISEKVQNKIYVFKEFGISRNSHPKFFQASSYSDQLSTNCKSRIQNLQSTYDEELLRPSENTNYTVKQLQKRENGVQDSINKIMTAFRINKMNKIKSSLFIGKGQPSDIEIAIKRMRGELFEELSYISLALLQRENFESTNACFRNYTFPRDFLQKFILWASGKLKEVSTTKAFSDEIISLEKKIYMLEGMLELSKFAEDQTNKSETNASEKVFYFYNFYSKKVEKLTQYHNGQVIAVNVSRNDQIYFHYTKTHLVVFLATQKSHKIYGKRLQETHMKCMRQDVYESKNKHIRRLRARNSTLVANNRFYYKAFGELDGEEARESYICVLAIDNFEAIANTQANQWQSYSQCYQVDSKLEVKLRPEFKVKLELKILGWGWALDGTDSSVVILGGGYNFAAQNEQKVNKFFYVIRDKNQISKIGKLSSEVINLSENIKNKNIVIPCVYGMPLHYRGEELSVLNTNGYCQKLNHLKKMFLSKVRIGNHSKSGIYMVAQNKMDYKRAEEDIANKNTILNYVVTYYNQVNRYDGTSSYCDSQGNVLILRLKEHEGADCVSLEFLGNQHGDICEEYGSYNIQFGKSRLALIGEVRPDLIKKIGR